MGMEPETETVAEKMRREWDARAVEDAKFYIATGYAGSDEEFRESGEADLDGAVLDGVVLSKEASALEIGCGVGRLLVPLASRIRQVHGVDISPAMIERSKAYTAGFANVSTRVTEGALTGVANASCDLVFSYIVFQHIPSVEPILAYAREAARVLAPGGVFRFQVDGRAWRWEGRPATTYDGVKFTPEAARALLSTTGFEIVDEWGADTHYHWITARRPFETPSPRVRVVSRVFDEVVLVDLLGRCGVADPSKAASSVVSGAISLRRALAPVEEVGAGLGDEAFVRAVASRVFERPRVETWV
ncbi:MAG TPA: methyltransferase domain-containing protein, partial [Thermoanaerobaculia bacterium]|nr:methyltransferase domain-containing protein [Thermoanaerobaculia bacterium]